jgi:hypothetical protein
MPAMTMFSELTRSNPVRCTLWALAMVACGDNFPAPLDGPPLARAESLFVIAHFDDDMIFMQPELLAALEAGPVTTVYVMSGDPVYGLHRTDRNFGIARISYTSVAGSANWECGYVLVAGSPANHCRLRDRPVSLIGLDIPDGGIDGQYDVGPRNLVEGGTTEVPILGWAQGTATVDTIIDSLAALITETQPAEIHALDLASNHGRDHISHLFSSAFAFWAAARIGYAGPIHWHRGYNVDAEEVTLVGADYEAAKLMLGYFNACYFGCAPCGSSCTTLVESHDFRLRRQYGSTRSPLDATGTLALEGDPALCLSAAGAQLVLADCTGAAPVRLDPGGHLTVGGACVASGPGAADPVVLEACSNSPAQYWVSDSDGHLWNGRPAPPAVEMEYDHVRCLSGEMVAGAIVTAPICGSRHAPVWQLGSGR